MELVDMRDLGSRASRRVGSSPTLGTINFMINDWNFIDIFLRMILKKKLL